MIAAEATAGEDIGAQAPALHSLNPRARLLVGLVLMVQVIVLPLGWALGLAVAGCVGYVVATRPPVARLGLALVALGWMLAFTVLIHGFTTPGHVLWQVPGLSWRLTGEGLVSGGLLAGRLTMLSLLGVSVSISLSALETIRSLNALLHPLHRLRVPVSSLTLMLGMTLRFVPTLYQEAMQLKRSLRARGWTGGRTISGRVRAWVPLFIPLLVNSLHRADDLAETLVLRGYDPTVAMPPGGLRDWRWVDSLVLTTAFGPLILYVLLRLRIF